MALHFATAEYERRKRRLLAVMQEAELDGMLLFRQDSMYWLTGYDSLGYVFFQCLFVTSNGDLILFSRPQDLAQAEHTSIIRDVVLWQEGKGISPALALRDVLRDRGAAGSRLGVEWDAYGLTAAKGKAVAEALDRVCRTTDASGLVARLRAVKSEPEIQYIRQAAKLADQAFDDVRPLVTPGRFDGDLLATLHGTIFRGGGGFPAIETILNSGPESILVRHHAGRRVVQTGDAVLVEFAAPYRRYHAGLLRSLAAGHPAPKLADMHRVCVEALEVAEQTLHPGEMLGDVFDRQAEVLDGAGFAENRLHSCGYGLGASFPPSWVDWPMVHSGCRVPAEPGMTLLLLVILLDRSGPFGVGVGHTVLVGEAGAECLSSAPLELNVGASSGEP